MLAGLPVEDFSLAYSELLALNAASAKSKEAIAEFIAKKSSSPSLLEVGLRELTSPLPHEFEIPTTPNAKEILEYFRKFHTLALVTGGHPPFQREKLKKAGIDSSIFSKIAIPEDSIKGPSYEGLIREFSVHPDQVLVCGDRIAMDLAPGFKLGFTTVHMRWGRGARLKTEEWVHYSITDLNELKGIVKT